jgi:hypothetical protein
MQMDREDNEVYAHDMGHIEVYKDLEEKLDKF